MAITEVGPWVIMILGIVVVLVGLYLAIKRTVSAGVLILVLLGLAVAGTGPYGIQFLTEFRELAALVNPTNPSLVYSEYLGDVGSGGVSTETFQEVGLTYILEHPTEDLGSLLDAAISAATDEKGKAALESAKAVLEGKEHTAEIVKDAVVEASDPAGAILELDPAIRALTAQDILAEPADLSVLERRGVTRIDLERLSEPLPQFGP